MPEVTINMSGFDAFFNKILKGSGGGIPGGLAGALTVEQLEQVDQAFEDSGQPSKKWPALKQIPGGFRKGGKPLLGLTGQTRALYHAVESTVTGDTVISRIASGSITALYHHFGFQTAGPNYIPLTRKGARLHKTGANPEEEGLVRGVDFIMAFKGVTVPPRPQIDYDDPVNRKRIKEVIIDAFKRG